MISEYSVNYLQKRCGKLLILLMFWRYTVEMKSPRYWALQLFLKLERVKFYNVEMKSPI